MMRRRLLYANEYCLRDEIAGAMAFANTASESEAIMLADFRPGLDYPKLEMKPAIR